MRNRLTLSILCLTLLSPLPAQSTTHTGVAPAQMVEARFTPNPRIPTWLRMTSLVRSLDGSPYPGGAIPSGKLLIIREAQVMVVVAPRTAATEVQVHLRRGDTDQGAGYFGNQKSVSLSVAPSTMAIRVPVSLDVQLGLVCPSPKPPWITVTGQNVGFLDLSQAEAQAWGYLVDSPGSVAALPGSQAGAEDGPLQQR